MSMILRRQMMTKQDGYITDGLVLWLDGIDRGNTENAWTDKIGGHVFTAENGASFTSNALRLSTAQWQYLQNSSFNGEGGMTIEVACSKTRNNTAELVFFGKSVGDIAFGFLGNNSICWGRGTAYKKPIYANSDISGAFSVNTDQGMINGTAAAKGSNDSWVDANNSNNFVGRRGNNTGTYFDGDIYSIRIYSRNLTADEMLHNQRIDNARFNLGLTI